ncbi:hypothetical protein, partial [Pseudomonas brassicacearum]|uniref:hypothetical protein n=1 Tax=Pseudomonas brassicacearum TaxID=930166 RepID=UPI0011CDEE95
TRGLTQVVPQTASAGLKLGTEWAQSLAPRPKKASGDDIQLAERGEARPQGGPSNEPAPTARPS